MTKQRGRFMNLLRLSCTIFVFCAATARMSEAQVTVTFLAIYDGYPGGAPFFDLVLTQGTDGNFYGTTYQAGTFGAGTVFKMIPAGTLTTLYNFCSQTNCADGAYPAGTLVEGSNEDLYGTTAYGGASANCDSDIGCGTIFKMTSSGKLITLYNFCSLTNCADGQEPFAGVVQGTDGNFYGTAKFGGANNSGTVFKITPGGKLTTIYSFCPPTDCEGQYPTAGLVQGSDGNFYGETAEGGINDNGTVFKITPAGKLTTLFQFNLSDGDSPSGGLIQGVDGSFYGVTTLGGSGTYSCCGTVFKITRGGALTTLYVFCGCGSDGALAPYGPLVQGTDGNFYGTTSGNCQIVASCGTIFKISPAGDLTTLYSFCANNLCGYNPTAGLLQATSGTFYGTTSGNVDPINGYDYGASIFSMSTDLGPFVRTEPASSKEGATIGIFGQGFDSSSVVQFGGVQATTVKLSGSTFIEAAVPAGALTGAVTVTTAGTTLASNQVFRVTPQVLTFNPPSGPAGTQVTITGTGFTQTTGVGFGDHVPAQFTVNSDTQITATVPTGAETGQIGVVTKGGTAISAAMFTVN